jgi:hypothetical protein
MIVPPTSPAKTTIKWHRPPVSAGTGRSSSEEGLALAAMSRSSSAPAVVERRRHAATVARTGRCGSGSLPSSPAGRCGAPAAAGSSFRARSGISATPTTGSATTEQSTRFAIGAQGGHDQRREAGGGERAVGRLRRLPPDTSGLPVQSPPFGLNCIGESTDEVDPYGGHTPCREIERGARPTRTPARILPLGTRMNKGLAVSLRFRRGSLSDSKEPQHRVDDSGDANRRADNCQCQPYAHTLTVIPRRPSATPPGSALGS